MKVKVKQNDLNFALSMVSKAINPNNTLPILNNIRIAAEKNELAFASTNLEIAITLGIKAKVDEPGAITIPAKLLTSYVNLLPKEEILIETTEDISLKIDAKKSHTKIKGLKADDFPTIPEIKEDTEEIKIQARDLEKAINEVVFAASLNTTRPILSGVFVSAEENNLTLAATDSYRLAESKLKLGASLKEKTKCIVPGRTMHELSKILNNFNKEEVTIQIATNQILFKIEKIQLISRLIEGAFPDYTKIIPSETKTTAKINSSDLLQALKRVNLFAREVNNSIHLEAKTDGKKLILSTDETKVGEEETELDVEITGENNKISINSQYLLDVLTAKEGEKIVLDINEKLSPIKVRPEKNTEYVYIIMPLKV